jgi:hypothetical protein
MFAAPLRRETGSIPVGDAIPSPTSLFIVRTPPFHGSDVRRASPARDGFDSRWGRHSFIPFSLHRQDTALSRQRCSPRLSGASQI